MSVSEEIEKLVKTSVTLTKGVWERAKIEAVKRGLTLAQVVEAALKRYLEILEEERAKGR